MSQKSTFLLMSSYNQWMNKSVYDAASQLSVENLVEDTGAFFKSILGTLNHILVGDVIWLQRFAGHPASYTSLQYLRELDSPVSLDAVLYPEFGELRIARERMDAVIVEFVNEVSEKDLQGLLNYHTTAGEPSSRNLGFLIQHFFNHQTHHRGQISTLLSQQGVDIGVTDLLVSILDETRVG